MPYVGPYSIDLFPSEIQAVSGGGYTVNVVNLTAQTGNLGPTPLITPSSNGWYRVACYIVLTQAATTSAELPYCALNYTDADSNVAEQALLISNTSTDTVGTVGPFQCLRSLQGRDRLPGRWLDTW